MLLKENASVLQSFAAVPLFIRDDAQSAATESGTSESWARYCEPKLSSKLVRISSTIPPVQYVTIGGLLSTS